MQYGVVVFKNTANIGDDIQAYAASKFYPHLDYYIDREKIDSFYSFNGERVAVIMAGWYTHSPLNWPPSPYIYPLMVSMHFTKNMTCQFGNKKVNVLDNDICKEWFKMSGNIGVGVRDTHTLGMLKELGIEGWWSGCITLTLEKFENVPYHGKIICVDTSPKVISAIKERAQNEVLVSTHYYDHIEDIDSRMNLVEERLKLYQGASLIVTTRLHAALPAIALGVPVLYVISEKTDYRFDDYRKYMHCIHEEDLLNGVAAYDFDNPIENRSELKEVGRALSEVCKDFVRKCEQSQDEWYIDFEEFYRSVKGMERLKQLIYMENNSGYLQGYSQKEEDPFILYQDGLRAWDKGELSCASEKFAQSFHGMRFENKVNQMEVMAMYIRSLKKMGYDQEVRKMLNVLESGYGNLEEYKDLIKEFE